MKLRLTSSSRRQFLRNTTLFLTWLAASPAVLLGRSRFAGWNRRPTKRLPESHDIIVVDNWVLRRSDVSDID